MTDQTPFSGRRSAQSQPLKEWTLRPDETEEDRLQRYCDAMNKRDPLRRHWFVAKPADGPMAVEVRDKADLYRNRTNG